MPTRRVAAAAAVLLLLPCAAATAAGAARPPDPPPGPEPVPAIAPPPAPLATEPGVEVVEVVLPDAGGAAATVPEPVARQVAEAGGVVVGAGTGSVLLVEVPAAAATDLQIDGAEVREPVGMSVPLHAAVPAFGNLTGESATAIGAPAWHDAGYDGTGVRIGVIDFFSTASFWNTAEMGPKPTAANGRAMCRYRGNDCIAGFDETVLPGDGRQHGPAVVEVIRDIAPNADVFIASAETYSDYIEVLDWFAANGVTIVSRSLGSFLDGPGDGTGPMAELADHAVSLGMVWLNAAGNEAAGGYWRGPAMTVNGNVVSAAGQTVRFADVPSGNWMPLQGCTTAALRWNGWDTPAAKRSTYALRLYRVDIATSQATLVATAPTRPDPLRQLPQTCPGSGQRLFLQVEYRGGGTPADDVLEIQDYRVGLGFHQAAYSATLPAADSANPSVLAVGAVDPPDGTHVAAYSSRGPTNDGRHKPDLVAPAGIVNSLYGTFSGTSAATPAAAGAAALLLQAGLATAGAPLAALLRTSVLPIGSPVPNNDTGAGVVRLPAAPAAAGTSPPTAYHALAEPLRIVDTRPTSPVGPAALTDRREPGTVLDVPAQALLGRTTGAVAAIAINLTVVDAVEPGWVQVLPTRRAAIGASSNLNLDAVGQTRSNIVQVPLGADGSISVYLGSGGHVLIDVLGTYEYDGAAVAAGRFHTIDPVRVVDTRRGTGATGTGPNGAVRRGEAVCLDTDVAGIATGDVHAVVLNVTATEVQHTGYVQALPTGGAIGATSTLNVAPGATVANTTIVPLGGPCGATAHSASVAFDAGDPAASAHLVVDITGYITGPASAAGTTGLFVPLTPGRVLDSRPTSFSSGSLHTVQVAGVGGPSPVVPAAASGVAVNLTATATTGWGYLSAWPAGAPVPDTSSLNWSAANATIANGAIIRLSPGGALDLRSMTPDHPTSAAHLVDVAGYYT